MDRLLRRLAVTAPGACAHEVPVPNAVRTSIGRVRVVKIWQSKCMTELMNHDADSVRSWEITVPRGDNQKRVDLDRLTVRPLVIRHVRLFHQPSIAPLV